MGKFVVSYWNIWSTVYMFDVKDKDKGLWNSIAAVDVMLHQSIAETTASESRLTSDDLRYLFRFVLHRTILVGVS